MTITYDILVDDESGHACQCLCNGVESKREANAALKFYRPNYPKAYLVRVVETRCREPRIQRGMNHGSHRATTPSMR